MQWSCHCSILIRWVPSFYWGHVALVASSQWLCCNSTQMHVMGTWMCWGKNDTWSHQCLKRNDTAPLLVLGVDGFPLKTAITTAPVLMTQSTCLHGCLPNSEWFWHRTLLLDKKRLRQHHLKTNELIKHFPHLFHIAWVYGAWESLGSCVTVGIFEFFNVCFNEHKTQNGGFLILKF